MTAADRPTEPPVECVAVDRDERCLCPGGPASHRPSPPAPAAEDDAVLRKVRAAVRRAATWTEDGPEYEECVLNDEAVDQVARAALDAAGVSALRAEVERLRERVGEFEEDRDDWVQVAGERAGQRDQARQQVADLRAGIEALLRGAYIRGWDLTVRADDLHALLAGSGDVESPAPNVATSEGRDKAVATSGEQPGWEYPLPKAASVSSNDRPAPVVHNHGTEDGPGLSCREERLPDGSLRGECIAPVVPDSTELRERLPFTIDDGNPRVLTFKSGGCRPARETETAMWDLLAVVGQGVTAEPIKIEWGVVVDDDGTTETYESREAAERMAVYQGGVCEVVRIETWPHSPAVVRSGEQGGEA